MNFQIDQLAKTSQPPPIGVIAKATDGEGYYDAMTALQLITSRGGFDGIGRIQSGKPDTTTAEKYNALNFQREPFADEPAEIKALWAISKTINEAEKNGTELVLTPDEEQTLAQGFEYAISTLEAEAEHASPEMAARVASLTQDIRNVGVYYAQRFELSDLEADLTTGAKPELGR